MTTTEGTRDAVAREADDLPAAWDRMLDALREAGRTVTGPLGARDERERAEGFRHLTRLLSVAGEMLLEKGDPRYPAFTRWMSPYRKLLGDNPGTIYDAAVIDPRYHYRIVGRRGAPTYLGVCVYGTGPDGGRRIVGNLDDVDLDLGDDGRFEVWLATDRPDGLPDGAGYLPLDGDATDVMIRQYFLDPDAEEATYTLEVVPSQGVPGPLTEAELAGRLDAVGRFVADTVEVEASLSALMATATPGQLRHGDEYLDAAGAEAPPAVDPGVVARAMPSPAITYSGSWFDDLGDDEAVVVEGTAPSCRYWSIQLLTRWMESGDHRHHRVFRTGADIEVAGDGTFQVLVAHRDPGHRDWIDTTGLRSANIAVRALGADGTLDIAFRRVPLPLDPSESA